MHTQLLPLIDQIVALSPTRFQQGPAGALIQRAEKLGWVFEGNGFIKDHEALVWHLCDCPIQWLFARLEHAWHKAVGSLMASRAEFAVLHNVDVHATFANWDKYNFNEQGIMRALLNGTFFTRDKLFHSGKFVSKQCPFCTAEDSTMHRHWQCHGLSHTFSKEALSRSKQLEELPECLTHHGWCVEPFSFRELRNLFCTLPDLTHSFQIQKHHDRPIHLFLDGSCVKPTDPVLRVATWAVVVADLEAGCFPTIAAGPLPGCHHTILRAEIQASIVAIRYAILVNHSFYLWTDNEVVYNRIRKHDSACVHSCCEHDHDLWDKLAKLLTVSKGKGLYQGVVKVCSHQDESLFSDTVDLWAIAGNESADRAAALAFQQLPVAFLQVWERCRQERRDQQQLRDELHQHFLAIGKSCVESKGDQKVAADDEWEDVLQAQRDADVDKESFVTFPTDLVIPAGHPLEEVGQSIFQWIAHLRHLPNSQPIWVTSYQMLLHYQMWSGEVGCMHDVKAKRWHSATTFVRDNGFSFIKSAGWFQAAVKKVAELCDSEYHAEVHVPHGTAFRCWSNCVLIRTAADAFDAADKLIAQNGPVKSVRKALANLSSACPRQC